MHSHKLVFSVVLLAPTALACTDDGASDSGQDEIGATDSESADTSDESGSSESGSSETTEDESTDTESTTDSESTSDTETTESGTDTETDTGEQGCQEDPLICEEGTVCDVITGECVPEGGECVLSGDSTPCGDFDCGPGTVCDDQGSCIAVAPCAAVDCVGDQCWGAACICDRPEPCNPATAEQLNGPFATDIFDLEFADDCTAWMVTLRSGTDFVRSMSTEGVLSEWAGVANLNMGEVKVLKALNPQNPAPPIADDVLAPNTSGAQTQGGDDNLGEVAITYTCCPSCGCFVDPPQGVARLLDGQMEPLPIVLPGVPTQGMNGPFGSTPGDAGPMGLTWGDDLRLYVGNSEANGNFDTVDLMDQSQQLLTTFGSRVTASAPLTSVHLLIALDTGELLRFNTETLEATPLIDLEVGVTSLTHDSYTGLVYASLSDLSVVEVHPFTGETADFETMPNLGRVAVSPDGKLWWVPAKFVVGNLQLSHWDLPLTWW